MPVVAHGLVHTAVINADNVVDISADIIFDADAMTYGKVKGTDMRTIDMTPTWETAVRIYMMVLEDGTDEGKVTAREELLRLARQYDALVADMKQEQAA
jgi:hypothetical protein